MSLSSYQWDFIKRILSIPSVGGNKEPGCPYGIQSKNVLDTFINECKSVGFETGIIDDKVGFVQIGHGDKLIGIVCHLDVVPAGTGWESDPFVPTIIDNNIYARGIVDDKGPALAAYFAMKELLDTNYPLTSRIRLILGTDEERTCDCVETYADKGEIPAFSFTPDAEFPVVFAEKGILQVKITGSGINNIIVNGGDASNMVPSSATAIIDGTTYEAVGKVAHASKPHLGINAITSLISSLEGSTESSLINFIKDRIVNKSASDITSCSIVDDSGTITASPNVIRINSEEQTLIIDIRYPVSASKEAILEALSKKAGIYGLIVEEDSFMAPLYKDKNCREIDILTQIWKTHMMNFDGYKEGFENNPDYVEPLAMGGGTYARHLPNTIAFGLQAPWAEDQCHQANEHMSINDFEESIKLIKDTIIRLCEL